MGSATRVRRSRCVLGGGVAACTAGGALLGWGARRAVDWLVAHGGVPLPLGGLWRRLAALGEPLGTLSFPVLGLLAGGYVAYHLWAGQLTATVTDDTLTIRRLSAAHSVPRAATTAVYVERADVVVLGAAGEEALRVKGDLPAGGLGAALTAHRWPWCPDGDPHEKSYRRFVPDDPALTPTVNALLKARADARARGLRDTADELRRTVATADLVVHDRKRDQYWRRTTPPG
ncbi:hypothetical protein GCM10010124_10020 [Pilimelia terevasa]|uniref:Uncharacterized protein n=1 Tax=Pilimelia terevasa TaxID=53372 RepID=A0A8J3FH15_9ACTN|nr:hypothetical protein [Pilimelia terevasa]GGK19427.1 hypothetical protein GCM10010124_10020 [Pilimelia terevasa]